MPEAEAHETIGSVLRTGTALLREAGLSTPELDARLLLAAVLTIEASVLLARRERPIEERDALSFFAYLNRRKHGEPVHRILGRRGFYGHEFLLSAGTLEPRPDTEIVVDMAIETLRAFAADRTLRFVDIGTGSGAIALSVLAAVPNAVGIGTDISEDALETAARNADAIGVQDRFRPVLTDYASTVTGPCDLVISNPPYISSGDLSSLDREVVNFDPVDALDGGEDGLDAYRAIAGDMPRLLARDGAVIVEIGFGQEEDVVDIFSRTGMKAQERRMDLGNVVRGLRFLPDSFRGHA